MESEIRTTKNRNPEAEQPQAEHKHDEYCAGHHDHTPKPTMPRKSDPNVASQKSKTPPLIAYAFMGAIL